MQRHDIFEEDPEEKQVKRPAKFTHFVQVNTRFDQILPATKQSLLAVDISLILMFFTGYNYLGVPTELRSVMIEGM